MTAKPRPPDKTRNQRQAERRKLLNEAAKRAGFETWAKLETAVINGAAKIVKQ